MIFFRYVNRALFLGCLFWLPFAGAQERKWSLDEALPVDENVLAGQLDNGLKYYIRENKKPEGRVFLRLVVNAGSLQENDSQRGLAHFLEHMAFNGTRRFEKSEIVDFMERAGMRFGSHVNAYTSHNETVYMLQLPTDEPSLLDTGFEILEDWATSITLDPLEIEKERGVILEEWRQRQGVGERLNEKQLPFIYYKSDYANRKPIGSMIVVANAPRERFEEFYKEWYRPNLMGVIVVGDIDRKEIERKIEDVFGALENPEGADERTPTPVPDHDETLYSIDTDPELTIASFRLLTKRPIAPDVTAGDYRRMIVERLYFGMLNRRLDERAREPNPPFVQASAGITRIAREKEALQQSVIFLGEQFQKGLDALLSETNRAVQDGFTESELERVKADVLRSLEGAYEERDKTNSDTYAAEYSRAFTVDEPIPGIEMELEMTQAFVGDISLEEVNAIGQGFTQKNSRVALFSGPEKEGLELPTENELLAAIDRANGIQLEPYEDEFLDAPLLASIPEAGSIVSEAYDEFVDTHTWDLSNGVQVVVKKTDFQNDEVLMSAFSPGGHSLMMDDEYLSALMSTMILGESGAGPFSSVQLEKSLAGKSIEVSPYISDQYEGFSGSSSPKDLESFFKLLHLQATQPRLDRAAYSSLQSRLKAMIANREKSPQSVFQDAIEKELYGDHPRHRPLNLELLNEIDPDLALQVFKNRFKDFSDFTFVFVGAIEIEDMKRLTEVYLASLPSIGREEKGRYLGDEPLPGKRNVEISFGLEEKTSVRILFTGEAEWSPENRYLLSVVRDLLNIRMRESLREENGGTYGVGVYASLTREPKERFSSGFAFSCDPANADLLIREGISQILDLQERGVRVKNLEKVQEIHLRGYETGLKENGFWLSNLVSVVREGREFREILDFPNQVKVFDPYQIQEAAKTYFNFDNVVVAKLNPKHR
jgi:zinc protease